MTFVLQDRIKVSSTSTGTGTFTLGAAVPGFQDFTSIGNGNQTYYTIINESFWEVGIGTYTASGTTLSRDTVLASSNNNALVDWQVGTKTVYVPQPAENAQGSAPTGDNSSISSNLIAWENFQKKLQKSVNANVAFKNNNTVGIVSTATGINRTSFAGGVLSMNGEIIFASSGAFAIKVSRTGVFSTFALVNTLGGAAYAGCVLAPNGDVHFIPDNATTGQKISPSGVVSTYSLVYTGGGYYGGVLAPNGDIYFVPDDPSLEIGTKVSAAGVVSTYQLIVPNGRYYGGVLDPSGNIYFVPSYGNTNQITKISANGVVSTLSYTRTVATNGYPYAGGALDINGNVHFVPAGNTVGTKISINGVVSTYSLVSTTTVAGSQRFYFGGVLTPSGDIHFLRDQGTAVPLSTGQKVTTNGVVVTYDKTNTSGGMEGGVLTPNGEVYALGTVSGATVYGLFKISINPAIPFELDVCISPFLNKF